MLNKRTSEISAINYIKRNYNSLTKGEIIKELVENTNLNYKRAMRIYEDTQSEIKSNKYKNRERDSFKFDTSKLWRENE